MLPLDFLHINMSSRNNGSFLSFQSLYFFFSPSLFAQASTSRAVLNRRDEGDIFISFPILGKSCNISPLSGMFVLDVLQTFFVRLMKFPSKVAK